MKTIIHLILVAGLLPISTGHKAQTNEAGKFTPAFEDNSMFLEEVYNQEDRVV
jgi:hypothetical protein